MTTHNLQLIPEDWVAPLDSFTYGQTFDLEMEEHNFFFYHFNRDIRSRNWTCEWYRWLTGNHLTERGWTFNWGPFPHARTTNGTTSKTGKRNHENAQLSGLV